MLTLPCLQSISTSRRHTDDSRIFYYITHSDACKKTDFNYSQLNFNCLFTQEMPTNAAIRRLIYGHVEYHNSSHASQQLVTPSTWPVQRLHDNVYTFRDLQWNKSWKASRRSAAWALMRIECLRTVSFDDIISTTMCFEFELTGDP